MLTSIDATASAIHTDVHATPAIKRSRLLIVGGGMAAYGLCKRLTKEQSHCSYDITIFGDEPRLAYDRVNLSTVFEGRSFEELVLADQAWYDEHQIKFQTGVRIDQIFPAQREVVDQTGETHSYDQLVLATGSRAFVPPIPGAESEGVFVYRTFEDLKQIKQRVISTGATNGCVIGGGLLGLEAAKVLNDLGLKTSVVEMAPGLMPRQLDRKAAIRLREHVESIGVDVHLVRRTSSIETLPSGQISVQFSNADPLDVDILIIAAGVRPNDELARKAGLEVGPRGGIVVDKTLQTSKPNIFAIGECAAFRDHVYGLVAPCYRMADTLAERLSGRQTTFMGADESAELKLLGVQVVTLGRAIGESGGGIVVAQEDDDAYRKLIIEQGKIVGAACVGPWEELPQIRQAVDSQSMLWPMQRIRFKRTGSPWSPGGALPVVQWPANAVVCSCLGVSRGQITDAIEDGAATPNQIVMNTGASTACGSCRSLVCELAGAQPQVGLNLGNKIMLTASLAAAVLVFILLTTPPISFAKSVQDSWRNVDWLWRDDFARQVTGYTTLALMILGLVFSLRKRTQWFQFGSYAFWRGVHGVLGAAVVIAMGVHTGLRLGENLNFLLAVVFLLVAVVGSVTGIASSLESRLTGGNAMAVRRWRPRLTSLHTWLFWPLPALVVLHVISFYWFSD